MIKNSVVNKAMRIKFNDRGVAARVFLFTIGDATYVYNYSHSVKLN